MKNEQIIAIIANLKLIAEKHKEDGLYTCGLNLSQFCIEVADVLDKLTNGNCQGCKHMFKRDLGIEPCCSCKRFTRDNYES